MVQVSKILKATIVVPQYGEIDIKFNYYIENSLGKNCGITKNKAYVKPGKINLYIDKVSIESKYIFNDQLYLGLRINTGNEKTFKIITNGQDEVYSQNPRFYRILENINITPVTEAITLEIKVYIDKNTADKFNKNIQDFNSRIIIEGEEKITLDEHLEKIINIESKKNPIDTDFSKLNLKPLEGSITKVIYFKVNNLELIPPSNNPELTNNSELMSQSKKHDLILSPNISESLTSQKKPKIV